ncbi:MAG TPA: efflux RND transporter periplasmic adaptor subunit [Methylomirabilota bacterium]|jgi:HlyD family secretion protein|nr:efflux RND transporter periplasmic adaptor subunit [Methylomirabilota bacterium]
MNLKTIRDSFWRKLKQRPKLFSALGVVALTPMLFLFTGSTPPAQELSFYEARRGDFLISVVEGGNLEAVNEVSLRSEVEGVARIIFIVPEGSYVKKDDLLVELDSSSTQDLVNQQQINVEKAQFALVQSQQQLEIQKSVVESEIQAAKLRVEFAQSDLEKFIKGEALQAQRNAEIEITNVIENLQIAQERLDWSEKLYKEGFETKGNLDKDRLTVSQTKLKREQTEKALWMVETFDNPKRKRALESALQEAGENLERVKLQDDRKLAQFTADVESQKKTLELNEEKLDRDKKQLVATKIYAPQEGLVVYGSSGGGRFSNESMIEEGAVVRNRQEIIKLPDVAEMKLQVKIHESHINQIRNGQPAFVVLDSMPEQRFHGIVNRIAPLPDSQSRWGNPDLKVYATEILITDKLPDIKPGVSARAEIVITNLTDALTVPIQSVSTHKGKQVVFLATAPQEPVPVTVGMYNTRLIQITAGLKEGDQVLLAPPVDPKEKDLGGAIIGESESASEAATNQSHTPALPTPAVPANSEPGGSAPAKVPATVLEKRSTRVADVKP